MKAALNGGLNLSILDGWWDECFDRDNGWAISSAEHVDDLERRDEVEAGSLFELLERQVVPLFYDRWQGPVPRKWVQRVKRSLITLGPFVTAARMVRDYTEQLYEPTAAQGDALGARRLRRRPRPRRVEGRGRGGLARRARRPRRASTTPWPTSARSAPSRRSSSLGDAGPDRRAGAAPPRPRRPGRGAGRSAARRARAERPGRRRPPPLPRAASPATRRVATASRCASSPTTPPSSTPAELGRIAWG